MIWRVLDDMHKTNISSDPQDQLAHNLACQAKLTGLCGAAEARDEAIRTYAYLYQSNAKNDDPVIAERAREVRERMMLESKPITTANWATTWAAVTSSRTVRPVTEHLNYAGQRTARAGDGAPGASRAGQSASWPRMLACKNCAGMHRTMVCPEQRRQCGCRQRVQVANGSLQGHLPGCVVLKSGDDLAILQTVQPQQSQQQSGSRGSSSRQVDKVDYHKQRTDVNQQIATFVEALKDCTDPATKAILAEGMAHAQHQIEHISIQEATAAARDAAEPASRATPFAQDQRGYASDDGAQSKPLPQRTSPSDPSPSVSMSDPRVFVRTSKRPVRTAPAVLTASVLALLAYIGGATVPQLVPGSYSIKKVPFLQTESAPPPAPPAGTKWQSIVVDGGCSVSVFDSPDKFAACTHRKLICRLRTRVSGSSIAAVRLFCPR
jgi:hypothetical protein